MYPTVSRREVHAEARGAQRVGFVPLAASPDDRSTPDLPTEAASVAISGTPAHTDAVNTPGHVDQSGLFREPTGSYPARIVADKIIFNGDVAAGLLIKISDAALYVSRPHRRRQTGPHAELSCKAN